MHAPSVAALRDPRRWVLCYGWALWQVNEMSIYPNYGGTASPVEPANLAQAMPNGPVLSSPADAWGRLVVQRYRHPPAKIIVPALRDHLLAVNLGGPFFIAKEHPAGRWERRWADTGTMSVTPADHPFQREAMTQADLLFIHVAPEVIAQAAEDAFGVDRKQVSLIPRFVVPDETLRRLGQLLLAEAEAGAPGAGLMADTLGRAVALNLLRRHSNLAPPASEKPVSLAGGRLRRVIEFMRAHIDEPLPLAQLAALSGLSQSQFTRGFQQATGQPPHRYLMALRIENACDLLAHTDRSVIEIGLQCGFGRPTHFATVFKKATGVSPRPWRIARRM